MTAIVSTYYNRKTFHHINKSQNVAIRKNICYKKVILLIITEVHSNKIYNSQAPDPNIPIPEVTQPTIITHMPPVMSVPHRTKEN